MYTNHREIGSLNIKRLVQLTQDTTSPKPILRAWDNWKHELTTIHLNVDRALLAFFTLNVKVVLTFCR